MKSRYPSTVSFLVLCVHVVMILSSTGTEARIKIPANKTVPAVIVFGDSIVDTGNNNNNVLSPARSNFPPYGRDFRGGKPTGRYSNGKVPSDLLVDELGIKELLPPYANPNLTPQDLLTGVCFAVGGVGYDPLTSKLAAVPPLTDQLEKFKEYIGKLKGFVGEERTNFILANSIIFVVLSSNDIANTYYTAAGVRSLQYDISSYTDFLVTHASDFIKQLYGLGTRRIGVLGAPPIGCVPSQRTLGGGIERNCYQKENEAAKLFNSKLSAMLDSLKANLSPDTRIVYVDVYNPLLNIIENPTQYGFKIAIKGCCGTGLIEAALLCNPHDTTCVDDSIYVFWDAYHPTEKAYREIVSGILTKYVHSFV